MLQFNTATYVTYYAKIPKKIEDVVDVTGVIVVVDGNAVVVVDGTAESNIK